MIIVQGNDRIFKGCANGKSGRRDAFLFLLAILRSKCYHIQRNGVLFLGKVGGNTSSVRKNILEYLESFPDRVFEAESYFPAEIVMMMTYVTLVTGHEIAVLLDRKNRLLAISLGDSDTVELPEAVKRRGTQRLSGIRLLHTHPNGTVTPSSIDINSLKNMKYDSMCVIGVRQSEDFSEDIPAEGDLSLSRFVTGLSASVLPIPDKKAKQIQAAAGSQEKPANDDPGKNDDYELFGPESFRKRDRFDTLFERALLYDKNVSKQSETQEEKSEKAILVGVITPSAGYDFGGVDETLAELCELAKTAGAEVAGVFTQRKEAPDARYYIGKGLAEELSLKRQALGASLIIFDDELSSSQINNLETVIGARVIDRTALVLDIFAMRANSKEGRLQVELAQQKYRLPRIMGQGHSLSRLGGGIGTRGPGETKLESDRRHIRRRIEFLEDQLSEVSRKRGVLRSQRRKNEYPSIAVVGYTNAGKSSLQNALCGSDSLCEDKLFATLDPAVRKMESPDGRIYLLTDTVGFIRKLPHDLVNAFKSTLEETLFADLLLIVADLSSPQCEEHIDTVLGILEELGASSKPRFLVLNKCDKQGGGLLLSPDIKKTFGKVLRVSALTGEGIDELAAQIADHFTKTEKKYTFMIPYSQAAAVSALHESGKITSEEYTEEGVLIEASVKDNALGKLKQFIVKGSKK